MCRVFSLKCCDFSLPVSLTDLSCGGHSVMSSGNFNVFLHVLKVRNRIKAKPKSCGQEQTTLLPLYLYRPGPHFVVPGRQLSVGTCPEQRSTGHTPRNRSPCHGSREGLQYSIKTLFFLDHLIPVSSCTYFFCKKKMSAIA